MPPLPNLTERRIKETPTKTNKATTKKALMKFLGKAMKFFWFLCFLFCRLIKSQPFTIVVLPDTQHYSEESLDLFEEQTTWICNNQDDLNIVFVSHEGDLVQKQNLEAYQWGSAAEAMAILDACLMPYSVLPGNHDEDTLLGYYYYDKTFPPRDNNTFPSGTNRNSFHLLPNRKLLFLSLEYLYGSPLTYRTELLDWANQVLTNYSDWTVFLTSHFVADDCTEGPDPYISYLMINHCNIAMAFGGHVFYCEGQRHSVITNGCGQQRWLMTANYQYRPHGGDGWLRFYQFDGSGIMCAFTYSTKYNEYETDPEAWFQLMLGYTKLEVGCLRPDAPLSGYVAPAFVQILFITTVILLSTFILIWSSLV